MRQVSKKFRLSCMAWDKNRRAAVKKGEGGAGTACVQPERGRAGGFNPETGLVSV